MTNLKQKFRKKEGIAFIITLGLLAVLMITGVSFAVYMKVERESAANFALAGSCRQLALAGVAYAMDDISFSLDKDPVEPDHNDFDLYPRLTTTWDSGDYFHGWYQTTADFDSSFTADDEKAYNSLKSKLYSNNKLAKELIPQKTFDTARKIYSVGRLNTFDIFDDEEFPDVAQNIAGNFKGNTSYIVVNLSGVLDPNFAGGETRGVGGTPAQFDLGELPCIKVEKDDVQTDANEAAFISYRKSMGYFDSMAEVSRAKVVTTADSADLKCMYPFSLFAEKDVSSKLVVYTNVANYGLAEIRALAEVLEDDAKVSGSVDSDFNSGAKFAAALNFIDYLDDDNIPGNGNPRLGAPPYATPCVEAFPMINEVYLSSGYNSMISGDQYGYKMTTKLNIELWYPFVSPKCADNYALEYTIRFGPTALETVNNGVKALDLVPDEVTPEGASSTGSRDWTEKIPLNSANLDASSNSGLWNMGNRTFDLEPNPDWRYTDLTNITLNLPAGSMVISVDAKIVDKNDSSIIYDGFDWDVSSPDDEFMLQFVNFNVTPIDGTRQRINEEFDMQVVDPRLNYRVVVDGTTWWMDMSASGDTLSQINKATQDYMATNEYADSGWQMFVKGYKDNPNSVSMESIGEFGYIFTGRPWETIRLCDKDNTFPRHLIYENLLLEGSGLTNSGCANINTEYEEVLRAALNNMPLSPGKNAEVLMDEDEPADDKLSRLVDKIMSLTNDGGISPTNLFESVNRDKIFNAIWPTVPVADLTDFEKEAFYISGMPNLRSDQQLFAIFAMGNYYASKQICMAIVWRDPVPDEDGNHPCFIRELTWLNGE